MNPNTKYKFATELPKGYSGILHFTNFSDEEFKAKWNNVVYPFPPKSTVPLVIPTESPIQTFNIRTVFAKQLADREFRKSKRAGELNAKNQGAQSLAASVSYNEYDLDSLVNRCLEPLPLAEVITENVQPEGQKRRPARVARPIKDAEYSKDAVETDTLITGRGQAL